MDGWRRGCGALWARSWESHAALRGRGGTRTHRAPNHALIAGECRWPMLVNQTSPRLSGFLPCQTHWASSVGVSITHSECTEHSWGRGPPDTHRGLRAGWHSPHTRPPLAQADIPDWRQDMLDHYQPERAGSSFHIRELRSGNDAALELWELPAS